ncbi:MAG: hypothetical protein JWR22_1360 [Herminiimonas sp.]|nr:hypothetical protein [Herminiimonas sp.]
MGDSFRRIVRAARYGVTVDDLHSDAFVIAHEIGKRRGKAIDFSDPEDALLVVKSVNVKNVKRGDWNLRKAVRLDQSADDDNAIDWNNKLRADPSADPFVVLLRDESAMEEATMIAASYSQAVAYFFVFQNFKSNREKICAHLAISIDVLGNRLTWAGMTVRRQPSLFDGVERIEEDFMPVRGRPNIARAVIALYGEQKAWRF